MSGHELDATVMLCDHAEAVNGKLYINGGGWTNLWAPNVPVNFSLAIILHVPWDRANRRHDLLIELLDSDGAAFEFGGQPIVIPQQFEVGRPPGVKPGTSLDTPLSFLPDRRGPNARPRNCPARARIGVFPGLAVA